MSRRTVHHPQSWCESCKLGACNGEHFTATVTPASMSLPNSDAIEHASIPYVTVGTGWVEWEASHCVPSINIAAGNSDAWVTLAEARQVLVALTGAIGIAEGLLHQDDHHLLCDCGENGR